MPESDVDLEDELTSGDEDGDVKKSTKKTKFGAFNTMGLSPPIMKGVMRRGYRLATPIQRKAIPHIMAGRDVVGMARTGSGKTAAFLVPMFEKLKRHLPGSGPRALILSPSRDLALQTARFVKEIGKYTDLRTAVIIGGDRLEDQFTLLHSEPDILVVTPGRLLHMMVEMQMKLSSIVYLVFDEADRLFELGFSSQVGEILSRTNKDRQTLLFSATLPSTLADFVAASLHNPKLVRLDVDTKLSPQLSLRHIFCSNADKLPILLHLLQTASSTLSSDKERKASCIIFASTRYHVDYVYNVITRCGIPATYAYSSMDPTCRKINLAKFRMKQVHTLVVTDVAARGIDIPELDVVINFNFPSAPKLFVHRVGRVARAGRCGVAYSLVASDEVPFLIDLNLFLGKELHLSSPTKTSQFDGHEDSTSPLVELGSCPRSIIDKGADLIVRGKIHEDPDVEVIAKAMANANAKYLRLRPTPSPEAVKQSKKMIGKEFPSPHSMFSDTASGAGDAFLSQIRNYRPREAFITLTSVATKQICNQMARIKESRYGAIKEKSAIDAALKAEPVQTDDKQEVSKSRSSKAAAVKKQKKEKQEEYWVPYVPKNQRSESALRLNNGNDSLAAATMDIADDERLNTRRTLEGNNDKRLVRVWHRQAKKFITIDLASRSDGTKCREKTESGRWIPTSFKTNKYGQWKKRNLSGVEAEGASVANRKGVLSISKKPDWRNKRKQKHGGKQAHQRPKSAGKSK